MASLGEVAGSMSGDVFLDWAVLAVSLFNTALLLWLGLTVLLTAERRTWGIWLAGGGLLMGGLFFLSHSAILGHGPDLLGPGVNFWWHLGWIPVVLTPFAWYVIILWYVGYWEDPRAALHRRHRPWFVLLSATTAVILALLIVANPLPTFAQVAELRLSATPLLGGAPLLVVLYPLYIIVCISLALDGLARPAPSGRVMGDQARRRARPWLATATLTLLLVGLLVGAAMLWIILYANRGLFDAGTARAVVSLDLLVSVCIAAASLLTGQAVVAYEIFTGKALPRHELRRYWRRAVILSGGAGVVLSWSLVQGLEPVYTLLLALCLMIVFYALLGWRSFADREGFIARLRPFITSQGLYHRLTAPASPAEVDLQAPFQALCSDVLGAGGAYLIPLGPLASLFGPPLVYPSGQAPDLPDLAELAAGWNSSQTLCLPLDPRRCGGAAWAVPLWSERGLVGVLLLAEKSDGGLYTQEEIEIARAVGERLVDIRASAEMARRLMTLQRQRLAESQVLDRRTRRVLHDEVLPRLHAALLALSSQAAGAPEYAESLDTLADVHRQVAGLLRELPPAAAPEVGRLGLVGALKAVVESDLGGAFDRVSWQVSPQAEQVAAALPPLSAEVAYYAAREVVRNAARYGRQPGDGCPLHLDVRLECRQGLVITIEDNGVGVSEMSNGSSGSGQGLALHSTMMAVVGGALALESTPGKYTRVSLFLPPA